MPMTYLPKAIETELPSMGVAGSNAFLKDLLVSEDPEKTIVSGFFRMEKSDQPLVYDYDYHEMKIIVAGEMQIRDETGEEVTASVGDVFYFTPGSRITFSSADFGLGFFCGQRRLGEA